MKTLVCLWLVLALAHTAAAEGALSNAVIVSLEKQRSSIESSLEILGKRQNDRRTQLAKQLATLTQMKEEKHLLMVLVIEQLVSRRAKQVRDTSLEENRLRDIADQITSEIAELRDQPLAVPALANPAPQGFSVWRATPGMTAGGSLRFTAQSKIPVRAAASGTIVRVEKLTGDTYIALIDHGRFTTIYSGILPRMTETPMPVEAGAAIGHLGPNGLGFEVRANFGPSGVAIDPRQHLR